MTNNQMTLNDQPNSFELPAIEACIIAGMLPLFGRFSFFELVIWAGTLALGGLIAKGNAFRWFAIAWIVSVLFSPMSFLLLFASGMLVNSWPFCFYASLLGTLLFLSKLNELFLNPAILLIIIAISIPIFRRKDEAI